MVSLSNPTTTITATGSSPQEREALWGPKLRELIGDDPTTWDNVSTMFPGGLITDDHPVYHDTILVDYQPVDNEEAAGGGESAVVSPELVEAANGVKKIEKKRKKGEKDGRGLVEVGRQESEVGSNDVSCGPIPLAKPAVVPSPTKGLPWTEQEHRMFLLGLQQHRKGDWKTIARNFVPTRSATQVASHAQKFYNRHNQWKQHRRPSIHDITSIHDPSPFINRRVINPTMATPTMPSPTLDFCVSDNIDTNMHPVQQQLGFMDNNSFQPEMKMMMMMMMMMMMQREKVAQPLENMDCSFLQTQRQPEMLYNVADDDGACGGFPEAYNVNDIDPYTCSCPHFCIDPYTYQPH